MAFLTITLNEFRDVGTHSRTAAPLKAGPQVEDSPDPRFASLNSRWCFAYENITRRRGVQQRNLQCKSSSRKIFAKKCEIYGTA
jgi:hypothetical protein